jgi:hypothetical protein
MKEITKKQAAESKLKLIGKISGEDMSKIILAMERLKEKKEIKYYVIESIIYNENNSNGEIHVSFWGDSEKVYIVKDR